MSGGFVSPATCGFAKVAALTAAKKARAFLKENRDPAISPKSQEIQARYRFYIEVFKDCNPEAFGTDFKTFCKRFPSLDNAIKKWNSRRKADKERYFLEFSTERWATLSQARKREHSFSNCKACYQRYAEIQALFPVRSPLLKGKGRENPFNAAAEVNSSIGKGACKKPGKTAAINAAREVFNKLGPTFEKWSGVPFGEALSKVPEANIEMKKSKREKKKIRRKLLADVKDDVEAQWNKTSLQRY